ncbi:MAG: bifunctional precorrin-2 dehydrogenase/sirohydrochlorin ferrochelatase [Nitrospinae bacterium]|nr:bifunctional precorrin-2 dehydrogenase/sirohydrochlorin ferrochelatase [Nitrospinota bacterium]
MPKFYPVMMDLRGRKCVVVGGGEVSARKAETLLECGAKVTVVSPELETSLEYLVRNGKISHVKEEYRKGALDGAAIAVAATDREEVNRAVYADATAGGIPVNVVDVPELCTFIVPSVVERGDLIIAISTSGKSPAMAKRIRKETEERFGPEYGAMLELMGEIRALVQKRVPELERRMAILSEIANGDLLERIKRGEKPGAEDVLRGKIEP